MIYSVVECKRLITQKKKEVSILTSDINTLKNFNSSLQIKTWRKNRSNLNKEIRALKLRLDFLEK